MSFAPIAATHAETGYELWLRYRLVVNAERARHWFKNGARPTSTTRSLLIRSGIPEDEVPAKVR